MTHPVVRLTLAAALLSFAGCSTSTTKFGTQETAKYSVRSTDNFVVDTADQNAVSCTGLIEQHTATGHLKVTVNIKSREGTSIQPQAQCLFRDARDIVVEETPWQAFTLSPGDTETLSFVATNADVNSYSVRVRLVH